LLHIFLTSVLDGCKFSVLIIGIQDNPAALGPGVYSTSNKNEYEKQKNFTESRALPALKADNLTAIREPIV
jgi:hypothetical protein